MHNQEQRNVELLGMFRAEYSRAKRFVYAGYGVDMVAAVLGVFAVGFASQKYTPLVSLAVAGLVFFGHWLKQRYDNIRNYAEAARRMTVLIKGADYPLSERKFAALENPFSPAARQIARRDLEKNKGYFITTEAPGPLKLFDMLQESAFWTHSLMEKAARYAGWMIIGFLILLMLTLYMAAFVLPELRQNWLSNLIVGLALVYLTSGAWGSRSAYQSISEQVRHIDDEMEAMREARRKPSLLDVFAKLNEYDCLMMNAPMLPDFMFQKFSPELNETWDKRWSEYQRGTWN